MIVTQYETLVTELELHGVILIPFEDVLDREVSQVEDRPIATHFRPGQRQFLQMS